LLTENGLIYKHLMTTVYEAGLGLLYGCLLGSATGLFLGANKTVNTIIMPLMVGLNGLPKLALAPILIIWFGIGMTSKVLIAGAMVYFVFTFNLYAGYRSVDGALVNAVRMLGGSRWQTIRQVYWPTCLPWFLSSLRAGVGMALSGAVVGEYIGASKGLGWLIEDASGRYDMARVLCCVLIMVVIIMVLDYLIRLAEKVLLKWRPDS